MKRSTPLKPGKPLQRKTPLRPGTKRMRQRHRACGTATKPEQAQQDAQRAHGCAMCWLLGLASDDARSPCGFVRVHHRTVGDLHGNKQLGQDATVGLGDWHHQGYPHEGLQADAMREQFGPSLALHKRDFLDVIADHLGERSTAALQRWQDAQLGGAA